MSQSFQLAIVGGGPRGLSALEFLLEELAKTSSQPFRILLLEESGKPGCGWVYDPEQPSFNWLNISDRALELAGREPLEFPDFKIPPFAGYQDWAGWDYDETEETPDRFTTRATLGRYLSARFDSLAKPLVKLGILTILPQRVLAVRPKEQEFKISVSSGQRFRAREVLLTVGHQETGQSGQMRSWEEHARVNNVHLVPEPYPIGSNLDTIEIKKEDQVALRGFGLAMIDMVRALVDRGGGGFAEVDGAIKYVDGPEVPRCIIPFSLDGLPMVPKPLNQKLDRAYNPGRNRLKSLEKELKTVLNADSAENALSAFIECMATLCAEQFHGLAYKDKAPEQGPEIFNLCGYWIDGKDIKHPLIMSGDLHPAEAMRHYVDMAKGNEPPGLDYCIGQVWRHAQPTLYNFFAFAAVQPQAMADIIALDERIKRYSYGPPVDSIEQLIALEEASVLKFAVVEDPDINLVKEGWEFQEGGDNYVVSVMINSVVDSPCLKEVSTPLVKQLVSDEILEAFHQDLGAKIEKDFRLPWSIQDDRPAIAMIGRLNKGSILGTDAILECFNPYFRNWAKATVKRFNGRG